MKNLQAGPGLDNTDGQVGSREIDSTRPTLAQQLIAQSRSAAGLVFAVLIVWLIFFAFTDGIFLSDRNIINLMRQTSVTAMVALGMLVVIAQGEIDLSVGSFLALCATIVAMLETSALMPPFMTVVVALFAGHRRRTVGMAPGSPS